MTRTLRPLISAAHDTYPGLTPDAAARAIWTIITEPTDLDAATLIGTLGAHDALDTLTDSTLTTTAGVNLEQLRARTLPRLSPTTIEQALRAALRTGTELVTPEHPHWPTGLADLGIAAPVALWVRGSSALLTHSPATAVIGARAATGYGEMVTMEISAGLVDKGHAIVSGAAYGIDGMAHRAALAARGTTIAVLGGGVDRFYPAGHDALLTRIAEAGAVVSEIPCGQSPTKWRFLARNRIIAAITRATIVVEAGYRSGSLDTAARAISLGRPVGAVPGPVTSAASAGCHRLIRDYGATLVTHADEADEF